MIEQQESIVTLVGIYNIMGEGLVVELKENNNAALYDRRGLQYRIIQRQKEKMDTSVEEDALRQMNSFNKLAEFSEFSNTSR